jgi:hypothetical protein
MRITLALISTALAIFSASAQTIETPVPFDTAGRIVSVNPTLANRLTLSLPAWPVSGAFVEARLYQVSTGGYTLVVSRSGGALERYSLDDVQTAALRSAFADAIGRSGRVVAEDAASIIAEPARGPFVRDQMIIASAIYGPSVSYLTHDQAVGTGLYMMTVGGTFFALNEFARKRAITKSQNALTTDGAFRGWGATALATNMLGIEPSEDAVALLAIAGGVGGSMVGFNRGKTLTNSEAAATTTMSTLGAGATLGLATTVGIVDEDSDRAASGVTAGDVSIVRLGALLGAAAAITPFTEMGQPDAKLVAGLLTTGWVGGALIADRIGAKSFNYSASDARMINLGALGGALIGSALPIMTKSENAVFMMSAVTGGAILGTFATHSVMAPARQGSLMGSPGASANSPKLELHPEGLLMAAARQRGDHTLLRLRF